MMRGWEQVRRQLEAILTSLSPGQFLILEYDAGLEVQPYAQVACEQDGYYCEVISEHYLPRDDWPIRVSTLQREGWLAPCASEENWSQSMGADSFRVGEVLISGLRDGRACRDASRFTWHTGTFPPGPDGGELLTVIDKEQLRAA